MVKKVLNSMDNDKSLFHTNSDDESPFEAIYYDIPVVMTVEQTAKSLVYGIKKSVPRQPKKPVDVLLKPSTGFFFIR